MNPFKDILHTTIQLIDGAQQQEYRTPVPNQLSNKNITFAQNMYQ
jgi:hypothetical protein